MVPDIAGRLMTVNELLPAGLDLAVEEDFIQAGQTVVELGRKAFIALGELVAWKVLMEGAETEETQTAIIGRYSSAWGVSKSNLMKAFVIVARWTEIDRPEDVPPTAVYEVLSGSDTQDEAEAGMELLTGKGLHVQAIREAKMLKRAGLVAGWAVPPKLEYRGGELYATDKTTGRSVWVLRANANNEDPLVLQALAILKMRAGW